MKEFIKSNKQVILLLTLINFILSPWWEVITLLPTSLIPAINFSLVIFATLNVTQEKILKRAVLLFGWTVLIIIWLEYINCIPFEISLIRMYFALILFVLLFFILIKNILQTEEIQLEVIINIMSGFILLGIIGGVVYECLDYYSPNSLKFTSPKSTYSFYYFSFINLTSVGFGDIIPNSAKAQAATVLLGILGQFYLAFGVAVFVGKYLSHNKEA